MSFFSVSVFITYRNNQALAIDTVVEKTRMLAHLYTPDTDIESFVKAGGDTRITIIAADGSVLADNRPLARDMHTSRLDRPEIQAALIGRPNTFIRYSDTLSSNNIYYALKVTTPALHATPPRRGICYGMTYL